MTTGAVEPGDAAVAGVAEESADVTVIGGGPSGLVAALQCARVGLDVLLLESADALGGAFAPAPEAGGADAVAAAVRDPDGEVRRWLGELHAPLELDAPAPAPWIVRPGRATPLALPADSILGIPGSPLSAPSRALLGGSAAFRAFLERWRPVMSIGAATSLGRLVRTRMGDAVADGLVDPVVWDRYGVSADDADPAVVVPGLNAALTSIGHLSGAVLAELPTYREEQGLRRIVGGAAALRRALEADLALFGVRVRLGARATDVEHTPGATAETASARVRCDTPEGGLVVRSRAVVVAAGSGSGALLGTGSTSAPGPAPARELVRLYRAVRAPRDGSPESVIVPAGREERGEGVMGWRVEARVGGAGERFAAVVLRARTGSPVAGRSVPEGVTAALAALGADAAHRPVAERERDLWFPPAVRVAEETASARAEEGAGPGEVPVAVAVGPWRHGSELGGLIRGAIEEASALRSRLIGTA